MTYGEFIEAKEATAEVSAHADLLQATALLKAIGELSPDAIYAKGVDGRFLYANPAVLATIGKAADEVLGHTDIEIHSDPQQAAITMANDRRIIEAGVPDVIEETWNVAEFDTRTYRSTKTPFYRDDGSLVGIICLSADITERKRAEETLRKNAALTRLAADAARMTYAEFDFRTGRLQLAENFARVMGYTLPSLTEPEDMPKTRAEMLSHIAPEYREQVQAANREFVSGERDGSIIYRVIGDDGAERWIEGRWIAEVDASGCPVRGIAASLDVTEQVKGKIALAEAKDKADEILASIGDGFYALDAKWRFVYFNAQAERLLNKKRNDVIGHAFFDVFPMVRDTQVHANYRQVMAGKQARDFEYISPILKRWTYFCVYPTREGGISVYFRDISRQKAVESELVAAKADAERADLAKSKFLAAASHDLRQPVQSLVLLLSVIERQVANQPKTVETAKMMRAAVDGLHGLLTSVLDISRLDAGVVAPVAECVDLGALIVRLATEYESKVANKALELRSVTRKLQSRTDAGLLERALRNLIENALRYTPEGGILLGVRRRGEFARIDVIDTGIGIPADKQSEIFVEFHQLNNPGRNLEQGLGLGLAIVSRLAKLLGAKVEVASRVGRGSRFSICLPLVHDAAPLVADRGAIDDPGGRILIIEDNAIVRNGLGAMLRQCGYETLAAAFGEDALELAAREAWRFDMIVADYRLGPGLTGVDAAKEISHRAGRSIPTLVLTGDTDRERLAEINASGFAILHKPVDAEDLRREMARTLSD